MDLELVPEEVRSKVFTALADSPVGIMILSVVAIVVTLLPFWKWLYSLYVQKKAEISKIKQQNKKDSEDMRNSIKAIAKHLPVLDKQVITLAKEMASFKSIKDEWVDNSRELQSSITEIKKDLRELADKTNNENKTIKGSIDETKEVVGEMRESTKKIESDLNVLFEGENNEFRIYLTQLHAKHVVGNEPLTRDARQRLRIKFESYEKRGGNGWAKELYLEIMALPIETFDLPDELN